MSAQHTTITVTPVLHGRVVVDATPVEMQQAEYTPRQKRFSFKRHYNCVVCGKTFREDEVRIIGGAAYCLRYKHWEVAEDKGGIGVAG